MNLKELKQFVKNKGEKLVIVEEGKAVMVVLNFEDYQECISRLSSKTLEISKEIEEVNQKLNNDYFPEVPFVPLLDQETKREEKTKERGGQEQREEFIKRKEIKLEDLPV